MDVMVRSYATPSGFRLVVRRHRRLRRERGRSRDSLASHAEQRRRGGASRRARTRARARAARLGVAVAARQCRRPRRRRGGVPRAEGERKVHARLRPHARRRRADDRRHRGDRARAVRPSSGPACRACASSAIPPTGCRRLRRSPARPTSRRRSASSRRMRAVSRAHRSPRSTCWSRCRRARSPRRSSASASRDPLPSSS